MIYEFSQYVGSMEGGSTAPWHVIGVDQSGENKSLVVKFFDKSKRSYQNLNPTLNEVIANILASELDLIVPEYAFVRIENNPLWGKILSPDDFQRINDLFRKRRNCFFCTDYIEGNILKQKYLDGYKFEDYVLETIFAFDVLCLNVDRRLNKPNLIMAKDYHLIDHELTFNFLNRSFNELIQNRSNWNFINPGTKGVDGEHLFLSDLKKHKSKHGILNFDTFAENFRTLNFTPFERAVLEMEDLGFDIHQWADIRNYLRDAKQNIGVFVDFLNTLIV